MQQSKILIVLLFIFIYILLSQFYFFSLGNIYTYIINPLFFVCTALLLMFMIAPSYRTNKNKKEIVQYVFITMLLYSLIYLLSGLLVGFGKNPYSTTIRGLVTNFFATGLVILCREYIRFKILNNVFDKNKKIVFILVVIIFSLIEFNIYSFIHNTNLYYIFKQFFHDLIPIVIKNILFTYIVMYTDYIPSFLYEMIYYLILWISPILPNLPWAMESILNIIFPFILLLQCKYYLEKKNRFHFNSIHKSPSQPGLLAFGAALVFLIWFTLGVFPIKPVAVATASMYPELGVGDLTFVKKSIASDIKTDDIIEYKMDGYTVIHRVKEIHQTNGNYYFTTKGDNNDQNDYLPVSEDQLLGKIIFKIPYVALPTIWIHNLNANNTQIEVQTGK